MIDKTLICRCGHMVASHMEFEVGEPVCIGHVYDSFCNCKKLRVDNLKMLEKMLAKAKD